MFETRENISRNWVKIMEAIAAAYGEDGLEKGYHLIPIIIIVDL